MNKTDNPTVQRLMGLIDDFAGAYRIYGPQDEPVVKSRQTLEAELTRLFTPLNNDALYGMYSEPSSDSEMLEFARAVEKAHGIGGKS